ncbi:MAG: hypothetical protein Tsb0014_14280 [Pleurocapsa sp.]
MNRDRYTKLLFPVLGFIILAFSFWLLNKKLSHYNLDDILHSLSTIGKSQLSWAVGFTIIGYLVISTYDILAFSYLNRFLHKTKIFLITFIVYGISNTTGFTLLIGGGIRYYFYSRWGISPKDIAKITAFGNLSLWLGLLTVGGMACIIDPLNLAQFPQFKFIPFKALGSFLVVIVTVYLFLCWRKKALKIRDTVIYFPSLKTSLCQLFVFTSDWALAAATLYVLLPNDDNLSYPTFFGMYLLGMNAAVLSYVPSGLGIFETVILFLLPQTISPPDALGSFLVYRTIRFLLPLAVAVSLAGMLEINHKLKAK